MKRNNVRTIGALLVMVMCLASVAPAMAVDWEQFHYDIANTGATSSDAPDTNQTKWTADIGAVEGPQAMIADGKVFVYANEYVHALDIETGTSVWTDPNAGLIYGDTSGWGSWASPAYYDGIALDGMLYVSSGYNISRIRASNGYVEELVPFPDGGHSCNGGPTVADNDTTDHGIVFAGSGYEGSPTSHYYAFNASDLSEVFWNFALDAGECAGSAPAVAGNRVIFGNGSSLTCVDKNTGIPIWSENLHSGVVLGSAAIDSANDIVYVATISGQLSKLHACNLTNGSEIWNTTPIKSTDGTPAFLDIDHVYISGNVYSVSGYTYCFNSTGDLQWTVPRGSWCMSPAVADGKLITGDCDDHGGWGFFEGIGAYDAMTGAPVWSYEYAGSSPSVTEDANGDGMVVSIGKNGKVYAFGTPPSPPSEVPAIAPPGFALVMLSLIGLGMITIRKMGKSE